MYVRLNLATKPLVSHRPFLTGAAIAAPVKNGRWLTSGLVARLSRTYMIPCAYSPSASVQHPANQPLEFLVGQRSGFAFQPALGNRRAQERTHLALEFHFERMHKLRQAVAKSRHA